MALLTTKRVGADVSMTVEEFRSAVREMATHGWTPAAVATEDHFLALAGVDATDLRGRVRAVSRRYGRAVEEVAGDVFFVDEDVFFCLRAGVDRDLEVDIYDPYVGRAETRLPPLTIGVLTPTEEGAQTGPSR